MPSNCATTVQYPQILQRDIGTDSVTMQIEITSDLVWFHGHFDDFPVLPGVVQLHWVLFYLGMALGGDCTCGAINNIKFTKILQPQARCFLEIRWTEDNVKFRYFDDEAVFSRGSLTYKRVSDKAID